MITNISKLGKYRKSTGWISAVIITVFVAGISLAVNAHQLPDFAEDQMTERLFAAICVE